MTSQTPRAGRRRTYLPAERVKADLMAATLRLLGEQRASSITVEAIAREAGHSRSLVYRHFGDKQTLVGFAIFGELGRWAEIVRTAPDPVAGFVGAYEHLLANPAITRASIFSEAPLARAPSYPVAEAHAAALEAWGVEAPLARHAAAVTMALYTAWAATEHFWVGAGDFADLDAQQAYGREAIASTIEALTGVTGRTNAG